MIWENTEGMLITFRLILSNIIKYMKKTLIIIIMMLASIITHAQSFYDVNTIQSIDITFAQSNWDALLDAEKAGNENYIMAQTVVINGTTYDSVGVKYKGNSTYNPNQTKNPFHIELDTYKNQDYQGFTDIKLSNVAKDPSFVREVLSYQILRQYMHAPLSNYANVKVNGNLIGLYSSSEAINKGFVNRKFFSKKNTFIKCNPIAGAGPGASDLPNLVYLGQDEKLTSNMAAKGAAYLGLNGKANKKAVAPNLAGLALAQAMKANGETAYDPLLEMATNGSAFEKGAALGALAATTDKAIADKLRDLSLAEDSPLTGRQANGLVSRLIGSDAHGDDTWSWLKENFAIFVERKVPDVRLGGMPGFARGCSLEARDEAKTFFESQADIIPGYERSLAQTLERIELCAALKDAKAEELTAALKAR